MTWSYGDWHEDMVALYDDATEEMVCWLQKQGGVDTKALSLIKSAPEMLDALRNCRDWLVCITGHANLEDTERGYLEAATAAIAKAEGRSE